MPLGEEWLVDWVTVSLKSNMNGQTDDGMVGGKAVSLMQTNIWADMDRLSGTRQLVVQINIMHIWTVN